LDHDPTSGCSVPKVKFRLKSDEKHVDGTRGTSGRRGAKGEPGPKGPKGDTGNKGTAGARGSKGAPGKSAYQVWLDGGNEGTKKDFLESLKGKKGQRGKIGYPGEPGPAGREGPAGPAGGESVPRSATLTRDANGSVETVTVEGEDTWTISRNADLSVASLTDTVHLVEVDRDGDGIVTGVTATEL
jgi:hypothetical protein